MDVLEKVFSQFESKLRCGILEQNPLAGHAGLIGIENHSKIVAVSDVDRQKSMLFPTTCFTLNPLSKQQNFRLVQIQSNCRDKCD